MKRLFLLVVLALAGFASTAGADTFRVLPSAPIVLPSAETPNLPNQIVLPTAFTTNPSRPTPVLTFAQLEGLWQRAGAAYGIPWQVLGAINKIESNFGQNMGPSSAGAVGWMQFMPDTWLRWGLDADGDGIANPWSAEDAVNSAARYLAAAGGQTDISRSIFAYNHAQWYVDEVLQLAAAFGSGGGISPMLGLGQLQQNLEAARLAVIRVNRVLVVALRRERTLRRHENRLFARVGAFDLLSDQLLARKLAVKAGVRRDAATARVERLRSKLQEAEATLEQARAGSQGASFSPGAGTLLAGPEYQSGYVFPVGGGPGAVSVSHQHHDYPAADIAAPAGSPVYALADGAVVRAWQYPEGACGIGFVYMTSDGLTWVYCHLAYLDPAVQNGVSLAGGASVGLVGQTGHATGPHLHLQLQPPAEYPQNEPWFQSFAGTAFRWQDGAPDQEPSTPSPHPVFRVVSPGSSEQQGPVIAFRRQGR